MATLVDKRAASREIDPDSCPSFILILMRYTCRAVNTACENIVHS